MVLNKGGYVMINKAQDNVYELATSALTSGKPILWYESNTECYFIDTIKLIGTDIILTKGGKTITIKADGDIIETGDVQNHLYIHNVSYFNIQGDNLDIQGDLYFLYNEDLTDILKSLNNTSGETAFNNIKALLDKVIFIKISNGADGGNTGYVEKDIDTYRYGTEGSSEELTTSSVDLTIMCNTITVKQLF